MDRKVLSAIGLSEFLRAYPGMGIKPFNGAGLILEGQYEFSAKTDCHGTITDEYKLRICVTSDFPREQPGVYEIGGRIQRNPENHINANGSLCLGTRLRVLRMLSQTPTLKGFAEQSITPYLFAMSYKLRTCAKSMLGELAHGIQGELADCVDLFGLETIEQTRIAIKYLGMKKRNANKMPCPCNCGRQFGKCDISRKIWAFRQLEDKHYFRSLLENGSC